MTNAQLEQTVRLVQQPRGAALVRLARCESGTTMTEFLILVPVFIIMFVGVLNLTKMNRSGVEVKMVAARNMWEAAIGKQTSLYPVPNMFNHAGGAVALGNLGAPNDVPDALAVAGVTGMMVNGHWGESRAMVLPIDQMVAISSDHQDAHFSASGVVDQQYALSLVDDKAGNNPKPLPAPPGGAHWLPWQPAYAVSFTGSRAAIGGNIIYGNVKGEHTKTVDINRLGSFELGARYDVLLSPVRRNGVVGEFVSVGFTRLAAQDRPVLKDQLSIDCSVKGVHGRRAPQVPWLAAVALAGWLLRRRNAASQAPNA